MKLDHRNKKVEFDILEDLLNKKSRLSQASFQSKLV